MVTGPITHYMYQLLERTVAKHSQFSFIKKVIIDRLLFAPPYLLVMFYAVAIMEVSEVATKGKGLSQKGLLSAALFVIQGSIVVMFTVPNVSFFHRASHTVRLGRK